MAATLRELLQRLASELTNPPDGLDGPQLDRGVAPRAHNPARPKSPPDQPALPKGARGESNEFASKGTEPNSSSFAVMPFPHVPENAHLLEPIPPHSTSDVQVFEPIPVHAGASSNFERRWQQLEEEWTRGLEQLTEMFRRTFVPRNELANLSDRIRDLECAQILRGRL